MVFLENMPPVIWLTSMHKNRVAGFESQIHPNMGYTFAKKKGCSDYDLYNCVKCKDVWKQKKKADEFCQGLVSIKISGNTFLTNPDEHPHICIGSTIDTRWIQIIANHSY